MSKNGKCEKCKKPIDEKFKLCYVCNQKDGGSSSSDWRKGSLSELKDLDRIVKSWEIDDGILSMTFETDDGDFEKEYENFKELEFFGRYKNIKLKKSKCLLLTINTLLRLKIRKLRRRVEFFYI